MSTTDTLDKTFAALADPTRRAILARLASGQASVTELAAPFAMSLPAVSKHLKVLERTGLVARGRRAQWRPAQLQAEPLHEVADWLADYRRFLGGAAGPVRRIPARAPGERTRPRRTRSAETREEGPDEGQDEREGAVMDDAMVREISITRIFAAPRDLVWRAWTEAEQLAQWFMPHGFTVPACHMDLRPGGSSP